jgi:beta-glucosidase
MHFKPLGDISMIDRRSLLAAATVAAGSMTIPAASRAAPAKSTSFPAGFIWGAATSAYQVEGNNINSDIWPLERAPGTTFAEPSADAANSFLLWETDLDLVKNMGLNSYRFSLEWARIEPAAGEFSIAMLDHYKAIIAGCHARGLAPMVTFNHFTVPIWFAAAGGWMQADAAALFARFCDRAALHLADGIAYCTTLNEPNLSGVLAMLLTQHDGQAMLEKDRAMSQMVAQRMGVDLYLSGNALYMPDVQRVQTNLIAGHREGRAAIKAVRADLPVGVNIAMNDDQASGRNSRRDEVRALVYDRWLAAAREDDFVGVQNYWRAVWDSEKRLPAPAGSETDRSGLEIYPQSLGNSIRYAYSKCGRPVIVTEHGLNTPNDDQRARFIPAALAGLRDTIDEGIPVKGYYHWSLLDNWEWFFGYKPQFGLHSVDRDTFARTPKLSAAVLGAIARRNGL